MNKTESSFEEQLELHGRIIYTNVGDSMMPFIKQGRDVLIIEKAVGPLKKYDVPLYRRKSGQYVLHRIIKAGGGGYRICGDNRISVERGLTDEEIIGVLVGLIRDGKEISLDTLRYKLYCFYICDLFFVRFVIFKFRALLRRIFGRGGKNK